VLDKPAIKAIATAQGKPFLTVKETVPGKDKEMDKLLDKHSQHPEVELFLQKCGRNECFKG